MKKDSYRLIQALCIALVFDGMLGASCNGLLSLIQETVTTEALHNTSTLQVFFLEVPYTDDISILATGTGHPVDKTSYTNDISTKSERIKQEQSDIHAISTITSTGSDSGVFTDSSISIDVDTNTPDIVQDLTQRGTNGNSEDSGLAQGNQSTSPYMIGESTSERNILNENSLSLELRNIVQQKIQSRLVYPSLARKQGIQGTVRFSVTISSSGNQEGLQLLESSGSSILDKAAFSLLKSIFSLGVQGMQWSEPIEIHVRITYTLDSP